MVRLIGEHLPRKKEKVPEKRQSLDSLGLLNRLRLSLLPFYGLINTQLILFSDRVIVLVVPKHSFMYG